MQKRKLGNSNLGVSDVPQCGYCQSGQIMAAAVLLRERAKPTDEEMSIGMAGNICRCRI